MALTYTEQLDEIQARITIILGGVQSFSIKDRAQANADLSVLFDERKRLEPLAAREARAQTGSRVRYIEVG
ncbi:MAG: hypothetical protein KJ630_14785 [Proteobacteria bacterium]|nr:hypothetical protein [Pseudomonadota bacterium]